LVSGGIFFVDALANETLFDRIESLICTAGWTWSGAYIDGLV